MKIGIIALGFDPGRTGGTETYFRNLIRALQAIDQKNRYYIFLRKNFVGDLEVTAKNFFIIGVESKPSFLEKVLRKLRLGNYIRSSLARKINAYSFDLVHFPFQVVDPRGLRDPKILSFMDLQQEYLPRFFSKEELLARRLTYKPSAQEADHIIVISDFTSKTLHEKYGIALSKISTVHLSYNEELFGKSKLPEPEQIRGIKRPYFYYPAATWPHKNHLRLIEAFKLVAAEHPYDLVLSGIAMKNSAMLQEKIRTLGLGERVHLLGYLSYEAIPAIYRQAFALVFPSLFEGFGIPLLEAMASNCPITAANTTSIPEVAGKAALYFDPLDVGDIAAKMEQLIAQPELRTELITTGKSQLKRFSSQKMAQETLAIYKRAAKIHA